jgi:hypothetical protein
MGGSPEDGEESMGRPVVGRTLRPEDEEERRRSRTIVRRKKGTDHAVILMCDRLRLRVVLVTSFGMLQERP